MRKRKFVFITFITSNLSIFSSNFIIIVLEFTFAQQKNTVSNTVNLLTKIQKQITALECLCKASSFTV